MGRGRLVRLAAAPGVWLAHFLGSVALVAVWCERGDSPGGELGPVWAVFATGTSVAFGTLALLGRSHVAAYRAPGAGADPSSRFLALMGVLLDGLAALGVGFVALGFLWTGSCA